MSRFIFGAAGLRFAFSSNVPVGCFKPEKFGPFACKAPEYDVLVGFHSLDSDEISCKALPGCISMLQRFHRSVPGAIPFETNCPICFTQTFQKRLEECAGHSDRVVLELRRDTAVVLDFQQRRMDCYFERASEHYFTEARIDPVAFSHFLHDFDALMLHSSCVSFGCEAVVFLAKDEGGKTTATRLSRGDAVLSDDQNLFRRDPSGRWLVHGTPWTTFPANTGYAAPGAFFLLEKSNRFSLQKLGPRELFTFLWNEHYPARFMLPKAYQTRLFDLYRDLSMAAPVYLMKFPRDHVDREAILKCLNP